MMTSRTDSLLIVSFVKSLVGCTLHPRNGCGRSPIPECPQLGSTTEGLASEAAQPGQTPLFSPRSGSASPRLGRPARRLIDAARSWDEASLLQPSDRLTGALIELRLRCSSQYPCEQGRVPTTQQRHRCDDMGGLPVGAAYSEPVARSAGCQKFSNRNEIGGLDGVDLPKAPNHKHRTVNQQESPGPQVHKTHDDNPERYDENERWHPAGHAPANQQPNTGQGGEAGDYCRSPPVIGLLERTGHFR